MLTSWQIHNKMATEQYQLLFLICQLTKDKGAVTKHEHTWSRSVLGSLQWYTGARYDIAYEMSMLAQFSALKALKRVLGYISTTKDKQLFVPRVKGDH